jgi:tRNA-Thr(GGU) m(6)t(6)A37 methyltransferase TsaA
VTEQAILEAAAELICDLGYAATSTNKIATRAGVSIGSLYQYFANKDAILARLLEQHHRDVHAVVDDALPALEDPAVPLTQGLRRLFANLTALHEQDPKLTRALSSEVPHPPMHSDRDTAYVAHVARLLRGRPDVYVDDPEIAAPVVVTAIQALTRWLVHDAPVELDRRRLVDETVSLLATYLTSDRRPSAVVYQPIGVVHTPFESTDGMPIQPSRAAGCRGTVVVDPEYADGLADLDGFSHVILLCHFHRALPHRLRVVPYLDDVERGLFATRSPSRPNPLGLSVVRLIGIAGNELTVENVDVLDGTPLLDIKPWVGELGDREAVRCGWLEGVRRREVLSDPRFGD